MSSHRVGALCAWFVAWAVGCASPTSSEPSLDGATRDDAAGATAGAVVVSARPARARPASTAPALSAPFDVSAVMRSVHFAFRPEHGAWRGGHASYDVRATEHGFAITPARDASRTTHRARRTTQSAATVAPLRVVTASIGRGDQGVAITGASARVERDGHLAIERGVAVEHLRNADEGVSQSWTFAAAPTGHGDLSVRVRVTGQRYRGVTDGGVHFVDAASGLGVRYGHATWIDARGARTPVRAQWRDGAIELRVPAAVVSATAFPATLDPVVGPEVAVDQPPMTPLEGQFNPAVAFNGTEWLVVWNESSALMEDVHGARVSASGELLDLHGITIAANTGSEFLPQVASNGTDFFVAWGCAGLVRGARVSAAGVTLDTTLGGIEIAGPTSGGTRVVRGIASNGSGYLITWEQFNWTTSVIGAVRVDATGVVLDPVGIELVSEAYEEDRPIRDALPAIDSDGSGYLVAWLRSDPMESRVVARRVASSGALSETVYLSPSSDFGPEIDTYGGVRLAFEGDHHVAAWTSRVGMVAHVFATRVSIEGALLDATPFDVSRTADSASLSGLAAGAGNVVAVWTQSVAGTGPDVRGVWIRDGVVDPSGFDVVTTADREEDALVACGGSACLVAWKRTLADISGSQSVRAARIDWTGAVLDPAGIVLRGTPDHEFVPAVACDGTNYLACWMDFSEVPYRKSVRCARLNGAGETLDPHGITVAADLPDMPFAPLSVASTGNEFLVAWTLDANPMTAGVYIARVSLGGSVLDTPPVRLWSGTYLSSVAVSSNGAAYLVAWIDNTANAVHAARVGADGSALDPGLVTVCDASGSRYSVAVASDRADYLVAWGDTRDVSGADLYAARVTAGGEVQDPNGFVVNGASGWQTAPALSFDGTNYLVAWSDTRGVDPDVFASRVSRAGAVLDGGGLAIASGAGSQLNPALVFDGTHHLAVWSDTAGPDDIRGVDVRTDGTLVGSFGFPNGGTTIPPRVASNGHGQSLVVYWRTPGLGESSRVFGRFLGESDMAPTCASSVECPSGYCVDGYCCDTACGDGATGDCQACSVAAGAATNGTCGAVAAGRVCRAASGACDVAEACDGVGGAARRMGWSRRVRRVAHRPVCATCQRPAPARRRRARRMISVRRRSNAAHRWARVTSRRPAREVMSTAPQTAT